MRRTAAFGLALLLLATGCRSGTKKAVPTTAPPTTASPTPPATTPPPTLPTLPTTAPPASATPTGLPPATGPAPARFTPIDFSFVGANAGWALGEACGTATTCQAVVARTTDSGHTWHQAPAPGRTTKGGVREDEVRSIRFGNLSNGWLFGPALLSTHDGGAHWKELALPGDGVVALEESGGTVWAVAATCYAGGCRHTLWTAPQDSDAFVRRVQLPNTGMEGFRLVRYSASFAWLVANDGGTGRIWRTTDAGRTWHAVPDPCGTAFDYVGTQILSRLDAANVWLLCGGDSGAGSQSKAAFVSGDGGRHWGPRLDVPLRGLAQDLVALGTQTALLSTTHSGLLRTAGNDVSWRVVAADCCDAGFGKIESIDLQHAWAIGPGENAIFYTADRGAHWGRFRFTR